MTTKGTKEVTNRESVHKSREQLNDLAADLACVYDQLSDRDWQLKPPRSGASGIEIKHTAFYLLLRDVAVAIDDSADACSGGLQI